MTKFKKQLIQRVIGIVSFSVLLVSFTFGLINKGDGLKLNQDNFPADKNFQSKDSERELGQSQDFYKEFLEEDEAALALNGYDEQEELECMFVGCGGFF